MKGALSVERSEDLIHARRLIEDAVDVSDSRDLVADADTDLDTVGR